MSANALTRLRREFFAWLNDDETSSGLPSRAISVFSILLGHMDNNQLTCYVSLERFERLTHLTRNTVIAGLRDLETWGLVAKTPGNAGYGGRSNTSEFRGLPGPWRNGAVAAPLTPGKGAKVAQRKGAKSARKGFNSGPERVQKRALNGSATEHELVNVSELVNSGARAVAAEAAPSTAPRSESGRISEDELRAQLAEYYAERHANDLRAGPLDLGEDDDIEFGEDDDIEFGEDDDIEFGEDDDIEFGEDDDIDEWWPPEVS